MSTVSREGVRRCSLSGCSGKPDTLAMIAGTNWIGGVAVDGNFVYFPVDDSKTTTVYRVAK